MAKAKAKGKKKNAGQHHLAAYRLRTQRKALSEQRDACEFLEEIQKGAVTAGEQTFVTRSWLAEHGHELAEELGLDSVEDAVEAMESEGLLHVYEDADLQTEIDQARAKLEALQAAASA